MANNEHEHQILKLFASFLFEKLLEDTDALNKVTKSKNEEGKK
ncbi:MAG TPA: hypothetical protein PKC96_05835 [Bacilli bacterium]|jgi:hypothetical protein|nr:hypothetical protein [Bacilli bacterium]